MQFFPVYPIQLQLYSSGADPSVQFPPFLQGVFRKQILIRIHAELLTISPGAQVRLCPSIMNTINISFC